jgi:hypothetical protein
MVLHLPGHVEIRKNNIEGFSSAPGGDLCDCLDTISSTDNVAETNPVQNAQGNLRGKRLA